MKVNVKLKALLLEKGLTQRELAFQTKIDEGRLSRIIRGYERPTREMRWEIADFLGVSEREIFAR